MVSVDSSGHQCEGPGCSGQNQPTSEAVTDLARLLSDNLGNNQKNWLSRARNALSFALYLNSNPAIFNQANDLSFTSDQVNSMEKGFTELKKEYKQLGNNASINAQVIGIGSKNHQLFEDIFSRLGEPLDEFYPVQYLSIWGLESRFSVHKGEIPKEWNAISIGANAYKGMPINAVMNSDYNPFGSVESFQDFVFNARHFQWMTSVTGYDYEWWDWWNPNSGLWDEKYDLYMKTFKDFVDLHSECSFIFENFVIGYNVPSEKYEA